MRNIDFIKIFENILPGLGRCLDLRGATVFADIKPIQTTQFHDYWLVGLFELHFLSC